MTDLSKAFSRKALISHIIAGYPDLNTTKKLIASMSGSGVDMIILEIPFSDPIAGGPEIQVVCESALDSGVTTDGIFDMIEELRRDCGIPITVMTYYNPIFVYGRERFLKRCSESKVMGIMVPDLPYEERAELDPLCRENGVIMVSMISPTYKERIEAIADASEGFVYIQRFSDLSGFPEGFVSDPSEIAEIVHKKGLRCITDSGPGEAGDVLRYADGAVDGKDVMTLVIKHGNSSVQFVADYARGVRMRI